MLGLLLLLLLLPLSPSSGITDEAETALGIAQRPGRSTVVGDDPREAYCESWRLSVEANNAGSWKKVPPRCADLVEAYVWGPQYALDSKVVARYAQAYANTVELAGDGLDAWIFDVDDTLLSNVQYYTRRIHGYGLLKYPIYEQSGPSVHYNAFDDSANVPALPWSLWLYKKLQGMGFQLILLTGRKETHRNTTEENLLAVGYHSWQKLILRDKLDSGKMAMAYKSEKRAELMAQGYRIHGSSGDQWSDIMGSPMAQRSFKVPNPMYHIP